MPGLSWNACKFFRQILRDLVFPPCCAACGRNLQASDAHGARLCPDCLKEISPILSPMCVRCGRPFEGPAGSDHLCGECIKNPPAYTRALSLFRYHGPIRDLLHRVKYRGDGHALKALSVLSVPVLPDWAFLVDAVIPVPLHQGRLRKRGFNQSLRLASILFPQSRLEPFLLTRTVNTRPQAGLGLRERAQNIKGAFAARRNSGLERVLLVDDIYTTGATVSECVKVLRKSGFSEIYVLTIARA